MESKILESKIRSIAVQYLRSFYSIHILKIQHKSKCFFCSHVEYAFKTLAAPYQKIINNDFFYQDYPGWWKSIYKKSDYLKLKRTASKKFLEAFYEFES